MDKLERLVLLIMSVGIIIALCGFTVVFDMHQNAIADLRAQLAALQQQVEHTHD